MNRLTVIKALSWSFSGRFISQLFQFGFSVALARMLSPSEFGVIGMLIIFTGFAQILSESGLNAALIHIQDVTECHRSTAFWLQMSIAAVLTVIFFFGARPIAAWYSLPVLSPLTKLISFVFLIQALGQVHFALLSKQFEFYRVAIANVTAVVISGCAAVILAILGYGVWALAWQIIAFAAVNSLFYWIASAWRPRLEFSFEAALELWRYAVYLLGHGSLNYWVRNGDNFLIGKFLGAYDLGIYSRAYTLMLLPLNNVSAVIGQVMFPALSKVQHDMPKFIRAYLSATRLIAFVAFPMMAGVSVLSGPVVILLLGEQWADVIPLLRVLSLVGLIQSIVVPTFWVYTALGHTKVQFKLSIMIAAVFAISMAIGIQFGVFGVTLAFASTALVGAALNLHFAARLMKISEAVILKRLVSISTMTLVMGIIVLAFDTAFARAYPEGVRVALGVACGSAVYLTLCVFSGDETFAELVKLVATTRWKRGSGPGAAPMHR